MDWVLIIIVAIIVLALLIFMNVYNFRDKKKLIDKLNNDYRKTKDAEADIQTGEKP